MIFRFTGLKRNSIVALAALLPLSACSDSGSQSAEVQKPASMTVDAIGETCGMSLLEHKGPKAQILLVKGERPLWFSQVRDAVIHLRSPENHDEVAVTYVHDMGKAESWEQPGEHWIDARNAWFVVESNKTSGMNMAETVPFGTQAEAEKFVGKFGGRIVRLDDIPDEYLTGAGGRQERGKP